MAAQKKQDELNTQGSLGSINQWTPLTRLHYFDGKYLRADEMTLEQDYYRTLVRLANLAGGWGVVYGLGVKATNGNALELSAGLAITPTGNTVLLNQSASFDVSKLIQAAQPISSTKTTATDNPGFSTCADSSINTGNVESAGTDYYLITVGPTERLCGNEEVYGRLCEDACVTDSQRPYWREGLMLRLKSLTLNLPDSTAVSLSSIHLRNRMASAYFATEPWLAASLLSSQGLAGSVWCEPAGLYGFDEVPVGIIVREGSTTRFIDAWSARRERMDTQARSYWQGRMMMRPWNVFIAHILQFQCQLSNTFSSGSNVIQPEKDDVTRLRDLLNTSVRELSLLHEQYKISSEKILAMFDANNKEASDAIDSSAKQIDQLHRKLSDFQGSLAPYIPNRLLLTYGFMELPSAGYLPVVSDKQAVNAQLQRWFGEGVNLHFCTGRPDYIPHAVEEAQHLERISLTKGLENPAQKEDVEIYVPDGTIIDAIGSQDGVQWHVTSNYLHELLSSAMFVLDRPQKLIPQSRPAINIAQPMVGDRPRAAATLTSFPVIGIVRSASLEEGGASLTLVCRAIDQEQYTEDADYIYARYIDIRIKQNPILAKRETTIPFSIEMQNAHSKKQGYVEDGKDGELTIQEIYTLASGNIVVTAKIKLKLLFSSYDKAKPGENYNSCSLYDSNVQLLHTGNAHSGQLLLKSSNNEIKIIVSAQWSTTSHGLRKATLALYQPDNVLNFFDPSIFESLNFAQKFFESVELTEISPPLEPESPERIDALNTLNMLATATEDYAFLSRATRLLFPDKALTDTQIQVRAKLDWIMFRRSRKAQCDLSCPQTIVKQTESFQVWHLKLENPKYLEIVQKALNYDDINMLNEYQINFQLVNVLHYSDADSSSVELPDQIKKDWEKIVPGQQVLLGWIWEHSPNIGQSLWWRLKKLVTIMSNFQLISLPADDVIATHSEPKMFADSHFAGGMLLVTADDILLHKVFFIKGATNEGINDKLAKILINIDSYQKFTDYIEKYSLEYNWEYKCIDVHFDHANKSQDIANLTNNLTNDHPNRIQMWGFVVNESPDRNLANEEYNLISTKLVDSNQNYHLKEINNISPVRIDHFGEDPLSGKKAFAATLFFYWAD